MRSFKPYPNEHDSDKQTRERRSLNFLQNLFPPKGNLVVNAQQKKIKQGKKCERRGKGRKRKAKDEGTGKLFPQENFAFCTKASLVLDLLLTFWTVSILFG